MKILRTVVDAQTISADPAPLRGEELLEEQRRLHDRVVARDESALLESFDRTGGLVLCLALMLTGRRSTAEDLTEALFVELWSAPEAFSPTEGPLGLQMIRCLAERVLSCP